MIMEDSQLVEVQIKEPRSDIVTVRSQGTRSQLARFIDYHVVPDDQVTDDGDLVHLALLARA